MADQDRAWASDRFGGRLRGLPVFWLVVALLVGIGLGLLSGWVIWPVDWYDTDPSDLRARHKAAYIIGVADSLAVTGDLQVAKDRIIELTDDEIDLQQVADLVESVAAEKEAQSDPAAALRVRRMAAEVGLPSPGQVPAEPAEPEAPDASTSTSAILVTVGLFLISAALVIGAVIRLLRRRAATSEAGSAAAPPSWSRPPPSDSGVSAGRGQMPPRAGWADQRQTLARPPQDSLFEEARLQQDMLQQDMLQQDMLQDDLLDDEVEEIEIPRDDLLKGSSLARGSEATILGPGRPASRDLPNGALGMFEAEYRYGDEDYDTAFTIEAADGEFLGECGLSVSSVLESEGTQKVNAFQLWLFDKNDIRTISQILVSRHAYENEALNAQLSAKGDLVLAEVEHSVMLETNNLQATAIIKSFRYLDDPALPPESAFERVNVEFVVEKANAF
ncbi:MAG: hypothetical protein JXA74_07570 [Anaerolineae bacterium]|nr:hypothetical protein [Anaerolineae bacterium]